MPTLRFAQIKASTEETKFILYQWGHTGRMIKNDSKKEFENTIITISMGYTETKNEQKKFERKKINNKKTILTLSMGIHGEDKKNK